MDVHRVPYRLEPVPVGRVRPVSYTHLNWSVAVREPDGGIYVEEHDLASGRKKNGWMYWPLVRGCRAMLESLVLGYKALEIAALHAFAEEGEDEPAAAEEAGGVCSSDSPARTNSPLDCSAPVSYTHLDVYKRQPSARFPHALVVVRDWLCSRAEERFAGVWDGSLMLSPGDDARGLVRASFGLSG